VIEQVHRQDNKAGPPYQVILMLAIVLGVIVSGFLVFPHSQEQRDRLLANLGTTNQGILLSHPLPVDSLSLATVDGQPWTLAQEPPKWRLLIPGGATCGDSCQKTLYTTRQMHIRLGKYSHRVQRLYLSLDGKPTEATLATFTQEQPYLKVLTGDAQAFADWLGLAGVAWSGDLLETGAAEEEPGTMRALLLDPKGNAMLYYQAEHTGNQMLDDLNHLLKYSPE